MRKDVSIKGLRSISLVFRVWPWYSTWKIQVLQSCTQKNRLQVAKYNDSYFLFFFQQLIQINGLVVKVSHSESDDLGSIPDECWNALRGQFAWYWARQCTDTRAYYIAVLSIISFFWISSVAISRWRVVSLYTTIWLPIIWRTGARSRASPRPHVLAWHMGRDYSDCRALELHFFLISRKYRKKEGFVRDFSKAHAQDWSSTCGQVQAQGPTGQQKG